MKRVAISLAQVADRENLLHALWRAARGKRDRAVVQAWLADPEIHLRALSRSIIEGEAPIGEYRRFVIHDPKTRVIHAASFADRVLHHAIFQHAGPVLERAQVPDTYACLKDRGVHRAVQRVQQQLRRYPWYVKVDVRHYFQIIPHLKLNQLLAHKFKGEGFLALLRRVVASNGGEEGIGLPIGSLSSQYFANYYLDGADRFLTQHPETHGVVRYMDDIVWWCQSRQAAHDSLAQFSDWLQRERALELHPNSQINRSGHGISYCGYRVTSAALRLSRRRKRRYVQRRRELEDAYVCGEIDGIALQQGFDAVRAITLPAHSAGFRSENLRHHPAPEL